MSVVNLMTGMPKIAMIGGAVGGLSQDPFENPFSAVLGAGIGAVSAMNMVYHRNSSPISKKGTLLSFDQNLTSGFVNTERSIESAKDSLARNRRTIEKLENLVSKYGNKYKAEMDWLNSMRKKIAEGERKGVVTSPSYVKRKGSIGNILHAAHDNIKIQRAKYERSIAKVGSGYFPKGDASKYTAAQSLAKKLATKYAELNNITLSGTSAEELIRSAIAAEKQSRTVAEKTVDHRVEVGEHLKKMMDEAELNADNFQQKVYNYSSFLKERKYREENILAIGKSRGIEITSEHLSGQNLTPEIASIINDGFRAGDSQLVGMSNPQTELINTVIKKTSISGNLNGEKRVAAMQNHFIQVMGHSQPDAERKAKMLDIAFRGKNISLVDGSLVIVEAGETTRIPLTSHSRGMTRFSKIDDTFYISKGVNPFALDLVGMKSSLTAELAAAIGINDPKILAKLRFDPEEYAAFFASGKEGNVQKLTDSFVRKNLEYIQGEADLGAIPLSELIEYKDSGFSKHAVHQSAHSLDFMKAIREKDGVISMVDVQMVGREVNGRPTKSQHSLILDTYRNVYGANPMEGQSVNTIGKYVNPALAKNFHETLGTFPSADRGYDAQLQRGYAADHAVYMNRFDVDSEMARELSVRYGDQYSIDDGSGVISRSAASKIREESYQTFEIHRSQYTGEYLINKDIAHALMADASERSRLLSEIELLPETVLGYDKNMEPAKIGNVFTSGSIHSVNEVDGKLVIRTKSVFDGSKANWIKLFGVGSKAGYSVVPDHIFEAMRKKVGASGDIDMIAGQSETGNKILPRLISGNETERASALTELVDQINRSNPTKAFLENKYFAKHLDVLRTGTAAQEEIAKSALFMLMQTDFKGNTDLATTVMSAVPRNGLMFRIQTEMNFLTADGGKVFHAQRDMALEKLNSIVNEVDINKMRTLRTSVSADLGERLHGVGNVGSMSWIERTQLKSYGATSEFLSKISVMNHDALFELSMIQSSGLKSSSITDDVKVARSKDIMSLFGLKPEQRAAAANMYTGASSTHVLHNLSLPTDYAGDIKSVSIPFISTNRSGIYEQETGDLLKAMDVQRRDLIQMDLEYATADEAKKKLLAPKYIDQLSAFEKSIRSSVIGESNIVKESSKALMPGSSFLRARSIGGKFASMMEKELDPAILISESQARELARRANVDISFDPIKNGTIDTGYRRLLTKDKSGVESQFKVLASREPAQGAYSILGANVFVAPDGMLEHGDVGIANTRQNMFKTGQFTDFDYDMLKIASVNFDSVSEKEHVNFVKRLMDAQADAFPEAERMATALSRKGNKATTVMHSSLESELDYISHQAFSSLKSKQRKFLASHTTDLSMNLTNALHKHLAATEGNSDKLMRRSIMGRTLIHNITESLLKSAHRSSLDLQNAAGVSEIESLKTAYAKLHDKSGRAGEFEADFRKATTSLFGANMTDDVKPLFDSAITDVINGAKLHAEEIEANGGRIQDFRSAKTLPEILDELGRYAKNGDMPSTTADDLGELISNAGSKISKGFHHIKRNIIANKKPIGLGLAALAATALVFGGDKPEMTKESLPFETSDGILPPLQSENAQVFKKKSFDNRRSTNIKGSYKEKGASSSRLKRDTFGHKNGRTNITIRDKRDSSY